MDKSDDEPINDLPISELSIQTRTMNTHLKDACVLKTITKEMHIKQLSDLAIQMPDYVETDSFYDNDYHTFDNLIVDDTTNKNQTNFGKSNSISRRNGSNPDLSNNFHQIHPETLKLNFLNQEDQYENWDFFESGK